MTMRPNPTRKAIGWSLMVLGVLGCVLPFLQGFLFLALGLFVLRDQHEWAARRWNWLAERWPGMVSRIESMEEGLTRRMSDWGRRARRMLGRA